MTISDTSTLTRTCQQLDFASAPIIAALEAAWNTIRTRHSEVPAAVVIVGPGNEAGKFAKWGHFASLRWQHGDARLPEVLVSGEGLNRKPAEVLATLLHEAAHGLADVRKIQDTSRQGRWHNKKFAALAKELGLQVEQSDKYGWSTTTCPANTVDTYAGTITDLKKALTAWRHPEQIAEKKRRSSNNAVACSCACPRRIRVAAAVLEEGAITCQVCDADFQPDSDTEEGQTMPRSPRFNPYDPTGERHNGIPTFPYKAAPTGLATRRQLRAQGLRPGGQDIAAQILWRKGKRLAYLYRVDAAKPKRTPTPAQLAAIDRALTARRTCRTCRQVKPYTIPTRYGECLDCQPGGAR